MSIKRYYGDNGQLLRYEMSKEMKERGIRYANKCKRDDLIKDTAIRAGIPLVVFGFLLIVALSNK